jgi:hypothetical protein
MKLDERFTHAAELSGILGPLTEYYTADGKKVEFEPVLQRYSLALISEFDELVEDINNGSRLILPKNDKHAKQMIALGTAFLNKTDYNEALKDIK